MDFAPPKSETFWQAWTLLWALLWALNITFILSNKCHKTQKKQIDKWNDSCQQKVINKKRKFFFSFLKFGRVVIDENCKSLRYWCDIKGNSKISLYGRVQIKIILWKSWLFSLKNSRVIHP